MKNIRSHHDNLLKLHYFPEIPVSHSSNQMTNVGEDGNFQPIDFDRDSKGDTYADLSVESIEGKRLSEKSTKNIGPTRQQAYEQGYLDGQKSGEDSKRKNLGSVLAVLNQIIITLDDIRKEVYHSAEKEVVSLALAIAEKIVQHEISLKKDIILNVLTQAIQKIVDSDKITIRVNPSDLQFLKDQKHQYSHLFEDMENLTFEEDETILSGGCLIDTNLGDIDARINKQFEAVEEAFSSELAKTKSAQT